MIRLHQLPADLINLLVTTATVSANHTDAIMTMIVAMDLMNETAADLINLLVTMANVSPNGTNAIVTTIVGTCQMNETALLVAQVIYGNKMANGIAALRHTSVEKTKVIVMMIPIASLVLYAVTTTADLSTQDLTMQKLTAV